MSDQKILEKNLWGWVKDGCKGRFPRGLLHMERIENAVSAGGPDVDGCLDHHMFKIELKTAARPAKPNTNVAVKFTKYQVPWHRRYEPCGGRAFMLIQVGSDKAAARYLIPGCHAAAVQLGVPESELEWLSITPSGSTAKNIIAHAAGKPAYFP